MRAWFAVLAVAACGGGGTGTGDDDGQPDAAVDAPSDGAGPGWTTLIERSWQLPKTAEDFKCIRVKVPTEMYISGFRVSSPTGTHHEILTVTQTTSPLGSYDCDGSNNDMQMLFAGGIMTNDLVFPPGVAFKLPANTYINLNLHLANYSDEPISGTSGIQVKTIPASEVVHEADMMFLGKRTLNIPANSIGHTESSTCSIPQAWTILQLWPHMHSYAKHQRVKRLDGSNQVQMLLDKPYTYMDQESYPMTVPLVVNDQLQIECVYNNPTNFPIMYGTGAEAEMCFAGFYKYPAGGGKDLCVMP
jgi:hypothetical protein